MTRIEKIKIAIERGIRYDRNTGIIYGIKGEIRPSNGDYVRINLSKNGKKFSLLGHHFAYYLEYGIIDMIDHIDTDKTNNKISNLRVITKQKNAFNTKAKGYTFCKRSNKFMAQIMVDGKHKSIGYYNTPEEARQAYLDAKKIYHII